MVKKEKKKDKKVKALREAGLKQKEATGILDAHHEQAFRFINDLLNHDQNHDDIIKEIVKQRPGLADYDQSDTYPPLVRVAGHDKPELAKWLIDRGFSPEQRGIVADKDSDKTPVGVAVATDQRSVLKVLLENGASLKQRSADDLVEKCLANKSIKALTYMINHHYDDIVDGVNNHQDKVLELLKEFEAQAAAAVL